MAMDAAIAPNTNAPQSLFKKRNNKINNRKRPATPPPASDSDESGYTSAEDEGGKRIKRRKKSAIVTASSNGANSTSQPLNLSTSAFTADRSTKISETNDATKQSNWFDEKDEQQLLGSSRHKKPTPSTVQDGDASTDGTYKGASAYQSYISKNPNGPSKQVGPVKAPTNIRTITVTDFAPDVCKDYKQTGFCGFGDSCKFLHAREDYKQGWELDKDWEVGGKNPKTKKAQPGGDGGGEDDEDKLLEKIPFACIICKEAYKNPIVTKCGHYFCEACALGRYRKSPNCAACGAGTNGVFNGAKQLKKLLEKKRERARVRREKAREAGEEVNEDDEDEEEDAKEAT